MNDDRRHDDRQPPDRDAAMALEALARLPGATPPAEARAQARAVFARGDVPLIGDPRPRQGAGRRWLGLLLAAALGVLAAVWFGAQPVQEWVVLDVVDPAGVGGAGVPVAVGARLAGGNLSTGPESELEVQLGDQLRFRMVPGTTLDLPRPPGRWFGRGRRLHVTAGEIYGTSGGGELDFALVLATDELQARLTGTTFAVFRTDEASCVCLWEGGITVTPLVGPEAPVVLAEQQRVWIYKDGRSPEVLPLNDMERMKLQMIGDAGLAPPVAGE